MAFVAAPPPSRIARRIDLIVVHCSATPSGRWLRGVRGAPGFVDAATVIDQWHAERGFRRDAAVLAGLNARLRSIGYHYVIDIDGLVESGRGVEEIGAHVQGFNARAIGICLVGGVERDARYTAAQWETLASLVRACCGRLALPCAAPLYPREGGGVCGHRDLSPDIDGDGRVTPREWLKTCPGFDVGAWLARGLTPTPDQICTEVRA